MKDTFSGCHPLVNLVFFVTVTGFSMIFMHPVCLAVSCLAALSYSVYLNGKKAVRFSIIYMLPLLALTALLNPLFNHEGATVLASFSNGNPFTLESVLYGAAAAVMLVTVVSWFSCFNIIMTSDKLVYLFGRVIPALSLVISMALRFVPRFIKQLKTVSQAQKCIGRKTFGRGVTQKIKSALSVFSIMVTWALENSIQTADSMRSRGYGLTRRTNFSIYRFDKRDAYILIFLALCAAYIIFGAALGEMYWRYFPTVKGAIGSAYTASIWAVYVLLCFSPIIIDVKEGRKWRSLRSKI